MRHLFLIFITVVFIVKAQIPANYYTSAEGLTGYTLKTELKNIISDPNEFVSVGYGNRYDYIPLIDQDVYFENDETVLDIYSENPSGVDSYNYSFDVSGDRCGNAPGFEDGCYNTEHIYPQGFFNQMEPMRSDLFEIYPTDSYVNGRRGSFPFGEVGFPTFTSDNGSRLGSSSFTGYTGTVFEPIDEFKGDIARSLLYFATRYEDQITTFDTNDSNNPTISDANQAYADWYINLLNKWHMEDPVSQREIDRNNQIYNIQGNRNPFIDHPEFVQTIWSDVLSTVDVPQKKPEIKVFPNPTNGQVFFDPNRSLDKVSVYSSNGLLINEFINLEANHIVLPNIPGYYILEITIGNQTISKKVLKK